MKDMAVIVTGAAAGLGRAIALRLADDEYTVAVTDIDGAGAERVAKEITEAGGTAIAQRLDVADAAAVESTVGDLLGQLGGVWGLVNNAGVGRATEFLKMTVEEWDWVQTVNARGTFLVSRYVAPHLVAGGGGAIVNISSIAGRDGFPMWSHYAASKHAVIGLTRAMARELGPQQVRVNAVCPGRSRPTSGARRPRQPTIPMPFWPGSCRGCRCGVHKPPKTSRQRRPFCCRPTPTASPDSRWASTAACWSRDRPHAHRGPM